MLFFITSLLKELRITGMEKYAVKDGKIYVQFKNVKGLRIFKLSVAKEVLKKMRP